MSLMKIMRKYCNLLIVMMAVASHALASDLFVCSSSSHQVLQFDGHTGKGMGPFTSIANPTGISFQSLEDLMDVSGDLFVCSSSSHQVLRFDGQTGDPMGPFC